MLSSAVKDVFSVYFDYVTDGYLADTARTLHEVSLHESIRYARGDAVEKWLNDLLCLDCLNIPRLISGCPLPQTCDLYP